MKEIIRLSLIGIVAFVLSWLAFGFGIATVVLLVSTHLVDLSHAEFMPAIVPILAISLAAVTTAAVVFKCRKGDQKGIANNEGVSRARAR